MTVGYAATLVALIDRPRILRERVRRSHFHGDKPGEPAKEKVAQNLLITLCLGMIFSSSYDAAGGKKLPVPLYMAGSVLVLTALVMVALVMRANPFALKVVYKQEGQVIITTGPYSRVRHPFYAYFSPFFVGMPLLIGLYRGLIPGLLAIFVLMWRTYHEEKFLVQEFGEEYERYQSKVPFRMFPGVF